MSTVICRYSIAVLPSVNTFGTFIALSVPCQNQLAPFQATILNSGRPEIAITTGPTATIGRILAFSGLSRELKICGQ